MPVRADPIRASRLVFAIAGLAVVAAALVGTLLLWSYREATLAAAAEREEVRVEARGLQLAEELDGLVAEVSRLSRIAEVDLADGNLEPEKAVLRLARRDTTTFSISIVLLDERGEVVWAEPRAARPRLPGTSIVGLARGHGHTVVDFAAGEIAVAAPVAGRGALAALVDGRGGHDLFGPGLRRSLRAGGAITLLLRPPHGGEVEISSARAGLPPPPLHLDAPGQAWLEGDGQRWLVTEAAVGPYGLVLREILSAQEVEGELAAPFLRLVWAVAAALVVAAAGGLILAGTSRRLERTELELARARDLAAMGKTAAAIAHEVKNALNGLSVGVDLLASGRAAPASAAAVHQRARAEISRLREVADDLTLFAAAPHLSVAPVDLAPLCAEVVDAVADLAEDLGATVRTAFPDGPVTVPGDRPKLLSALVNLARNGLEAMGPGAWGERPGEAAGGGERILDLALRRAGAGAVVEVIDRGAGIAPSVRPRLFEPFVTTKRAGTGLGLVIVRRVVEAHGGRVAAIDRVGGGTIFRVELPVKEAT